ncbi:hypothetical protein D3C76_525130 [compost metagenome]|uniref:Putative membrane protein n=1 Tax=Pseudomonas jinjuensis TaxID=198616 RepID=A0A1H0LGU6_9PSED|nr:DUF4142 domain-containing protein [Pseudomonas jinjuensis]SDO67389.1 putative membrane protein [Pseudomonas jinjuensis]
MKAASALFCLGLLLAPALPTGAAEPVSPRAFIEESLGTGLTVIDSARLALHKGESNGVRVYAKRVIDEHGRLDAELQTLAKEKGIEIAITDGLQADAAARAALLEQSDHFDLTFAEQQLYIHKQAVTLFEQVARDSQDAELRDFARTRLPLLEHHRDMAEQLVKGRAE